MNLETLGWDDSLREIFDIPKNILPEICSCDDNFGSIGACDQKFPITGVIGDQQSALFGQNCFEFGEMKSTYGTGCCLMVNTCRLYTSPSPRDFLLSGMPSSA